RLRIDVERVVRAGLHARLAADAPRAVEVDDPVVAAVEGDGRTDRHAGRRVAVIAAQHREIAPRVRERAALDVLHPRAKRAEGHPILFLARHRAGVAADALALVDHEAVTHVRRAYATPSPCKTMRSPTTASEPARIRRIKVAPARSDARAPSCAPMRIPMPMSATVRRSTLPSARNVTAPTKAEMLRTKCEVAVAMWIGRLRATIRNGTWMIPPPMPRMLDM